MKHPKKGRSRSLPIVVTERSPDVSLQSMCFSGETGRIVSFDDGDCKIKDSTVNIMKEYNK